MPIIYFMQIIHGPNFPNNQIKETINSMNNLLLKKMNEKHSLRFLTIDKTELKNYYFKNDHIHLNNKGFEYLRSIYKYKFY